MNTPYIRLGGTVVGALVAGILSVPHARAEPTIDLSWDDCSPIVAAKTPTAEQTISTLYVSATGLTESHSSYLVQLWFAAELQCGGSTHTPDAWRFDTGACQSGRAQPFFSFATKSCPPMSPPFASNTLFSIAHAPLQYGDGETPDGAMKVIASRTYDPTAPPDPATRYLMVGVAFDHSASGPGPGTPGATCGGLDTPVCFSLWPGYDSLHGGGGPCRDPGTPRSGYLRSSDGAIVPIRPGQFYATFNLAGSGPFGCFEATPVRAVTWGLIKGQYR